jgi:hypothetical protein
MHEFIFPEGAAIGTNLFAGAFSATDARIFLQELAAPYLRCIMNACNTWLKSGPMMASL